MKIIRLSLTIFVLLQVLTIAFGLRDICKYRKRQMTPGQSVTDCYSIVTCKPGGVLERRDSCPVYICAHKLRGYKQFNHRKSYPECCGGPTCDDKYKTYFYKP